MENQAPVSSSMSPNLPGVMELIKNSWDVFTKVWKGMALLILSFAVVALVCGMVMAILLVAMGITAEGLKAGSASSIASLGLIGSLIFLVFMVALTIFSIWFGNAMIFLVKDRAQNLTFKNAIKLAWPKTLSVLWVSILNGLVVTAGIILLVVPGIIFAIWFCFSSMVVIYEDIKGVNALVRSKNLVKGHFWGVFGRLIVMGVGVAIIGGMLNLIPFIGQLAQAFIVSPVSMIFAILLFENLKGIERV